MILNSMYSHNIKILTATLLGLSKIQRLLIVFFSIIFYLSFGFGEQTFGYRATIQPDSSGGGSVKVVLYHPHYEDYRTSGALRIPASGWSVTSGSDSTTLTAKEGASPLVVYSNGPPVEIGLLRYAEGGTVRLGNDQGLVRMISLKALSESVTSLSIGGKKSDVPPFGSIDVFPPVQRAALFLSILFFLTFVAVMQLRPNFKLAEQATPLKWTSVAWFALPLLVSTSLLHLSYWPANVAYDGAIQWHQAVTRGNIDVPLGVSATLFLRLFSHLSGNPALVIVFQSVLGALGISLILKELWYLGVPRWAAQLLSVLLSISPQYALFFTNLGKDALSAVGLLFLVWALLSIARNSKLSRLYYSLVVILIVAAVFSSLMRVNVLPTAMGTVMFAGILLYQRGRTITGLLTVLIFVVSILAIPKMAVLLSDEIRLPVQTTKAPEPSNSNVISTDKGLPLGLFGNFYIYHLFAAAVHSNVPLDKSDEELFLEIAPRSAWAQYDCFMTDTTFINVSNGLLLNQKDYSNFLRYHQLDLAAAVWNIVRQNPSVLVDRQICISKILWQIGYGQKPFQATATLGYDTVTKGFIDVAGENRSLMPDVIRANIQKYVTWSESYTNFWFFWKPALAFLMGLFCVLVRFTVKRDTGLLILTAIPLSLILVMAVVIPFPAYRYIYPAALLMMLLCAFAFSTDDQPHTTLPNTALIRTGRVFWIDICRILAIFGVILIHTCGVFFYKYDDIPIEHWLAVNLLDSLVRASVPLFVMISGALLLRSTESIAVNPIGIGLRIGKIIFPLIVWSIFYLWWIDSNKAYKVIIPEEWFGKLVGDPVMYHLWFAYMIMGLYVLMPLLQVVFNACKANIRFALYCFAVWIGVNFLSLYTPFPFIGSLQITAIFGFGGYFVLGGLLNKFSLGHGWALRWWAIFGCAVVVTFTVTWFRTSSFGIADELAYSYFSPNVFAASVAAFMLFKRISTANENVIKLVQWVSDSCFFIFFAHVVVLELLSVGAVELDISINDVHPMIYIPLLALATFLGSLAFSGLAKIIPGSRRILG